MTYELMECTGREQHYAATTEEADFGRITLQLRTGKAYGVTARGETVRLGWDEARRLLGLLPTVAEGRTVERMEGAIYGTGS